MEMFYSDDESTIVTVRNLREDFGPNKVPSINAIRQLVRKFEQSCEVKDFRPCSNVPRKMSRKSLKL